MSNTWTDERKESTEKYKKKKKENRKSFTENPRSMT